MKINIVRRPETISAELYLYEIGYNRQTITMFNVGENGEVISKTYQKIEGEQINSKPFMILMEEDMRNFIKAVLDFAKDEGYKIPDESYVKGKLEAQSEHLKDLRKISKL